MDAAAAFHIPPWKLSGGTKTLWYCRYEAIRNAQAKKAERDKREAERMRKPK